MLARPEYGTRLHILAWVAQQPQRAKFDWDDCTACAVARYADAHGQPNPFNASVRHFPPILLELNDIAGGLTIYSSDTVTWGRLRRALEKQWL